MNDSNLLTFDDGQLVETSAQWAQRRREFLNAVVPLEYGGMPPEPESVRSEMLHQTRIRTMEGVYVQNLQVVCDLRKGEPPFVFGLRLYVPPSESPRPVIIYGDGCWEYLTDPIRWSILSRGYALAVFNRVELAADAGDHGRNTGLHRHFPNLGFGALAAWAWGYHRCIDVLCARSELDADRIAITGHSRGGKTVLIAGATDGRIALTAANGSGTGGAALYKIRSDGAEPLDSAKIQRFGYWYGKELADYVDRVDDLPCDQHMLLAAIAPRGLLCTEAKGDLWANTLGTRECLRRVRSVYESLRASDQLGYHMRDGLHAHAPSDWQVFLDFADYRLRGIPPSRSYAVPDD
ncbi:MAG: alpha/beta hydrolase family protein [Candidatus Sumerlaeota bacterium]